MLQTVSADRGCFACMLGDDDGRTLYVVANRYDAGRSATGSCSPSGSTCRTRAAPDPGQPHAAAGHLL